MAISKEKLQSILSGKAKQLCNSDNLLNEIAAKRGGGYGPDPDPNDFDDYQEFDSMYSDSLNEDMSEPYDIQYDRKSAKNSMMPESIKKSLLNEKIDVSALNNVSVLDSLGIKAKKVKKRQPVNEQKTNYQGDSLKALIMECLTEFFSNNKLNESHSLNTITLKGGNINLIDNAGNVYSAQLKKIRD